EGGVEREAALAERRPAVGLGLHREGVHLGRARAARGVVGRGQANVAAERQPLGRRPGAVQESTVVAAADGVAGLVAPPAGDEAEARGRVVALGAALRARAELELRI